MEYFRIKVKVQNGTRSAWVVRTREKNDFQFFRVVNKDGDEPNNPEIIIASKRDIIYQKPAAFNNKYAELEIKESDMNKHNNLVDVLNGHLTKASGAKKVNEEKHVKTEYCAVLAGKDKPKRFKSKKDLESWILDEFIETGKNPLDQSITHQAYSENFFEDGDSAGVDNFTVEWSLKIS